MSNAFVAKLQAIPKRIYTGAKLHVVSERDRRRLEKLRALHEREIQRLLAAGATSFQRLAVILRDSKQRYQIRELACWVLGRLGGKQAAAVLLEVLRGDDRSLWMPAATNLALTYNRWALRPVVTILEGGQPHERREAAAYARSFSSDKRAGRHLLAALRNTREVPSVRARAAEGLGVLEYHPAFPYLVNALEDKAVAVRFWATYALAMLEDLQAIPALKRLAATDEIILPHWWSLKREAQWTIRQIKMRIAQSRA